MPAKSRIIGYSGSALELTVYPLTNNAQIIAYLWGGGGGGGGGDGGRPGGNGTGGGFSISTSQAQTGDQLRLFIGGGGQGGGIGGGAGGGPAGASYIGREVFNTRMLVGQFGLVARTLSYAWSSFMNAYAVWLPYDAGSVDVTTTISIPATGNYELQGQCDDQATFYIDGTLVLTVNAPGYSGAPTTTVIALSAGNHTLRMLGVNSGGGPAGIAFSMGNGDSFSGGSGGRAGPGGSSGGGGGGGGATVLLQNGSMVGVSAGGGGGSGAGIQGGAASDAPNATGQTASGYNGQNGQDHPGDGGGGGGGGGGWNGVSPSGGGGGNGGTCGSGDTAGQPGANGLSYSNLGVGQNPLGRLPGGTTDSNYRSSTAMGGFGGYKWSSAAGQAGDNGYAVIYLTVPGVFVHNNSGGFVATDEIYVKVNDVWQLVNAIYIKREGNWITVSGDDNTNFLPIAGFFGVVSRPAPSSASPEPSPGRDGGGWSGDDRNSFGGAGDVGGGASGGKIVCTMMNEEYGFGSYRNAIWLRHSARMPNAKVYQLGYHRLFMPLVAYAKGTGTTNQWVKVALEHIARHRTSDIYQQMKGKRRDKLGRMYRAVLEPLCYLVGKL